MRAAETCDAVTTGGHLDPPPRSSKASEPQSGFQQECAIRYGLQAASRASRPLDHGSGDGLCCGSCRPGLLVASAAQPIAAVDRCAESNPRCTVTVNTPSPNRHGLQPDADCGDAGTAEPDALELITTWANPCHRARIATQRLGQITSGPGGGWPGLRPERRTLSLNRQ
jgi:hypothetical protein